MIPTRYISAGPLGAKASNAPAQAQAQAGEAIGNAISQVGETGMAIVGKIRKVKDAGISAAFMAQAEEEADRFALALAKRSDTDAWPQDWKNKADSLKQLAQNQALSAEGKASLNADLVGWHSKKAIAFETQALSKELALGHARTTQTLAYHTGRLDKDSFDRDLKHAVKAGIYNPAEAEAAQMHFQGVEAEMDLKRLIEGNPQGMIDHPTESYLKRLPGATLEMVEQAKRQAKGVVKERAFDTVESAQDDIYSGKVTTPQMIDKNPRYAALRPTVRERLKKNLEAFQYEKSQGLMNTPEAQAAVVGKVSSLLSGWEPKAEEDADLKYAEIQGQIGRMPDGFMKTELERQAKAIRHGSWADSTSHADAAMKSLDAAAKAGRFGVVPEVAKIPTARLVKDGFLKDPAKLQRLGFSEDQAGQIVGAASEDPAKGQGLLSELWSKRDSGNVKGSEFEIATGNALRLGHATVTGWDDPESEDAAISAQLVIDNRLGDAKMGLAEFLRITPKATVPQIDGKILDMAGEQTVRELKSGIYGGNKSTSGGPAGASGGQRFHSLTAGGGKPHRDREELRGIKRISFEGILGLRAMEHWLRHPLQGR